MNGLWIVVNDDGDTEPEYYGPFNTVAEAEEWALGHLDDASTWDTVQLIPAVTQ